MHTKPLMKSLGLTMAGLLLLPLAANAQRRGMMSRGPGTVSAVAAVATRSVNQQNGAANDPTIEVTVGFTGTPPADIFDAAPVDIIVTDRVIADVLTVPVPALIALSGGGHAVELVVDGGTQLIGVELGDYVGEIVEIRGDLQEGDTVVLGAAG